MKKLFVVLLILFIIAFLYFSHLNPGPVEIVFARGKVPWRTTIPRLVLASFALGVFLSLIYFSLSMLSKKLSFARERKKLLSTIEDERLIQNSVCYFLLGDESSLAFLEERLKSGGSNRIPLFLSLLLWKKGEEKKALEVLESWDYDLSSDPCSASLYALLLFKSGEGARACEFLERAVSNGLGKNVACLRLLRDLYINLGLWDKAHQHAKAVFKVTKDSLDERRLLGTEYELLKAKLESEPKQVLKGAKRMVKGKPDFFPGYTLMMRAYSVLGSDKKEKNLFNELLEKFGPDPRLIKMVEEYFIEKGSPDEALEFYKRALMVSDNSPEVLFMYGEFCERVELVDEAVSAYGKIRSKGLFSEYLVVREACLLSRLGRAEEVRELLSSFCHVLEKEVAPCFRCEVCGEKSAIWKDFCENCLSWGSFRFETGLKKVSV